MVTLANKTRNQLTNQILMAMKFFRFILFLALYITTARIASYEQNVSRKKVEEKKPNTKTDTEIKKEL